MLQLLTATLLCAGSAPRTSWCDSVVSREWMSIVSVKSCVSERNVLTSSTTAPPPSTVSIVRASRLGVMPSKSYVHTLMILRWSTAKRLSTCKRKA